MRKNIDEDYKTIIKLIVKKKHKDAWFVLLVFLALALVGLFLYAVDPSIEKGW